MLNKIFMTVLLLVLMCSCDKKDCIELNDSQKACTFEYNPVCGCNEKTYGNPCMAESFGIDDYEIGKCK